MAGLAGLLSVLFAACAGGDAGPAPTTVDPAPATTATATVTPAPTATAVPPPTPVPTPTTAPPDDTDLAFDFTLPNAHGGDVTLSNFRGDKNVVLVFYRAFW